MLLSNVMCVVGHFLSMLAIVEIFKMIIIRISITITIMIMVYTKQQRKKQENTPKTLNLYIVG